MEKAVVCHVPWVLMFYLAVCNFCVCMCACLWLDAGKLQEMLRGQALRSTSVVLLKGFK